MSADQELATLLARVATRDRAAFKRLFDLTSGRMLAIAMRILNRRDLAEEAVQDAYLSIWTKAGAYRRGDGAPLAWISVIVRRRAVDRLRASPWLQRESPDFEDGWRPPPGRESVDLRRCLEKLDDKTRYAICLSFLYGMTHQELSAATSIPLGTVKSRLRRGLLNLKACLDDE
ncbi:MAG: sigma factor-like helix-turn-helix DNA-binding protein [Pseudomonadota bacterium]